MQMAIEISHAMQSFSGENSFLGSAANLSDVHLYQPDLGGGIKKNNPVILIKPLQTIVGTLQPSAPA